MKTLLLVPGFLVAVYIVFEITASNSTPDNASQNNVPRTTAVANRSAQSVAPNAAPRQQQPTPHQQRLAALREKRNSIETMLALEYESIEKMKHNVAEVSDDEIAAHHEIVEKWLKEKEAVDAAIKEEEQEGGSEPEPTPPTVLQTLPHHQVGETFSVGYWTYRCCDVQWSQLLGNGSSGTGRPDAAFAVVYLMMRNDDDSASTLPLMKLVDSDAQEYEPSPKAVLQRDSLDLGKAELDSKASANGAVIFDVPPNQAYYLRVSGGYWSNKDALIDLTKQ